METKLSMLLNIAKRMPRANYYFINVHPILFKNDVKNEFLQDLKYSQLVFETQSN